MDNDARTKKYKLIELFGKTALYTVIRIDRDTVPDGLYAYDLRRGDSGYPVSVEPFVDVNHAATIIMKEPLDFKDADCLSIGDGMNFLGEDGTLEQFADRSAQTIIPDSTPGNNITAAFHERIRENYEGFVREWLAMEPTYLIQYAEEIAATKQAYDDVLSQATEEHMEYFLRLPNPLETVRDVYVNGPGYFQEPDVCEILDNIMDGDQGATYADQTQGGGMELG